MAIMHERYAPGADTGADMLRHEGEEGGVVVRGRIELTVGGEPRPRPGDAYYFTSAIPHRFRNAARSLRDHFGQHAAHVLGTHARAVRGM